MGELHVSLVNLALRHEALVTGELADPLGSAQQDVGRAGLGEEEEHCNADGSRSPDGFVE